MKDTNLSFDRLNEIAQFCENILKQEVAEYYPDAKCFAQVRREIDFIVDYAIKLPACRDFVYQDSSTPIDDSPLGVCLTANFVSYNPETIGFSLKVDRRTIGIKINEALESTPVVIGVDDMMSHVNQLVQGKTPDKRLQEDIISDVLKSYFGEKSLTAAKHIIDLAKQRRPINIESH